MGALTNPETPPPPAPHPNPPAPYAKFMASKVKGCISQELVIFVSVLIELIHAVFCDASFLYISFNALVSYKKVLFLLLYEPFFLTVILNLRKNIYK
jgi:hypothetical protein